ncbi:MAG TPA: S46 family peptidase, partial [Gemmatimonadaceae bacterium]|nr:S46 family peptidase [Gemmatimonadaceae bacterium]
MRTNVPWLRLAAPLALGALLSACASSAGRGTPSQAPSAPATPAPAAAPAASPPESTLLRGFGTMWTFDNPPTAYWKQRYGFAPDRAWLDHVRLAAVRLPQCSASLVSARGLVMTNHHCGRDCSAAVSPRDSNYVETGFVAASLADEKRCPGFHVDQLESIQDVTARVQGAMTGRTLLDQARQRDEQIHAIESECEQRTKLLCQVVTLYEGGRYSLYRYRRYDDIRLVMAPEKNIAYFGGDPDNFTYPRYDLDLTLLRVYDHDAPLSTTDYLHWSSAGARPGELVFVIGNPGSTNRLLTVAQLEYLRDVQYPAQLSAVDRILRALRADSARSPERARALQNEIFEYANAQKAWTGEYAGLRDTALMDRKRALERAFRGHVEASAALRQRYGSAWDQIASAMHEMSSQSSRLKWSGLGGYGATLGELAKAIVRVAEVQSLPDSARPEELRGAALDSVRQLIEGDVPIDTATERALLVERLRAMERELAPGDPIRRAWLDDQTPEQAAQRLVGG